MIASLRVSGVKGLKAYKNAWFSRFAHKEKIPDAMLWRVIERLKKGQIDADLGGGVIKQRIPRAGSGKARAYRGILLFRKDKLAVFVFGYPKSRVDNIDADELQQFRKLAKHLLNLSDPHWGELVRNGSFQELIRDE